MTRFEKALELLKQVSGSGSMLGLERVSELASAFGDPQNAVPVIHVAGTNGKGSFCAMMASVLSEQGLKVGTFNSPAMLTANDQIRINGEPVSEELFADTVIRVYEKGKQKEIFPTEFEIVTVAAFLIFIQEGCDIAVVECGMGGDGDATNIISRPILSVITNVSLDHCNYLGGTTAEIASHKAGIIKQGRPVYYGGGDISAYDVIKQAAALKGSELYTIDDFKDIIETDINSDDTAVIYRENAVSVPLKGAYQVRNLVNVLSCIEILRSEGYDIGIDNIRSGLAKVHWEGRFEQLSSDPLIIFDGAHNPDGMEQLCRSIEDYFPNNKPAILIGVLADKDYALYGLMLKDLVDRAFTVAPVNPRALSADELAKALKNKGISAEPFDSIVQGLEAAVDYCLSANKPLLIIGSLYMYKDVKTVLNSKNVQNT
ncbi:MAG: bifunctional folylpolyglutamate synthase/dihydrofolate synthase [Ruminococcus sp.]|nr:bifunctional folylpolyglutamate synthase/dihydrofolate synthase [Ruminococcus sp.]